MISTLTPLPGAHNTRLYESRHISTPMRAAHPLRVHANTPASLRLAQRHGARSGPRAPLGRGDGPLYPRIASIRQHSTAPPQFEDDGAGQGFTIFDAPPTAAPGSTEPLLDAAFAAALALDSADLSTLAASPSAFLLSAAACFSASAVTLAALAAASASILAACSPAFAALASAFSRSPAVLSTAFAALSAFLVALAASSLRRLTSSFSSPRLPKLRKNVLSPSACDRIAAALLAASEVSAPASALAAEV